MTSPGKDAEIEPGQVASFEFIDPILGTRLGSFGIVLDVAEGAITIAPVAGYTLTVPAADVRPADRAAG